MGSNRSGRRRSQRMNRHRKEMARLVKKAMTQADQAAATTTATAETKKA